MDNKAWICITDYGEQINLTHILTRVNVWQGPPQYCEMIALQ